MDVTHKTVPGQESSNVGLKETFVNRKIIVILVLFFIRGCCIMVP
jgi:hypothetical protein